ncbi:MAG: phosphoglycolate phosphatase [Granulosicoccus sp.]|nr:phosphoglycolate phosphatase [Granulosicoccus sp.]
MELVAIDLDGTLVDSVKDLHQAVNTMQAALSRHISDEDDVRHWVGNGIERLVHRALTGDMLQNADAVLFEHAMVIFRQAYANVNGHYSSLYPGVRQGLEWMASLGVPMVMVTNKASAFSRPLLKHLAIDKYFAHQIGGDDVTAKKPSAEPLLLAASLCSATPQRSLLIGDSIADFQAARAAGFACIGVSYGYNHGRAVRSLDSNLAPDAVIDSFLELPAQFARLQRGWV